MLNPQIYFDNLTVMQDSLRHSSQVSEMIQFVENGGFWTQDALKDFATKHNLARICPVMEVISFPDGKLMVHDGHHRIFSTIYAGRNYIRGDEYILKYWEYEDYLKINFKNGWVTPFDPRTEIRLEDFGDFKKKALKLASENEIEAIDFINRNKKLYAKTRNFFTVLDFYVFLKEKFENSP